MDKYSRIFQEMPWLKKGSFDDDDDDDDDVLWKWR
jgi:hypothetical protein